MSIAHLITLGLGSYGGGGSGTPVDVPVLAVVDNADGTGAVATVTGSTTGTTNTIYSQPFEGGAWTSRGSRTGDGTIAISLTVLGYYWWKVVSTDGSSNEASNIVDEPITDGLESVHERAMQAIRARLLQLTFATPESGVAPTEIIVAKLVQDLKGHTPTLPSIVVGLSSKETINAWTNNRDEYLLPVAVAIWAKDDGDLVTNRAAYTKWREQAIRALNRQRLSGVPEVIECTIQPSTILPTPQWLQGKFASTFTVLVRATMTRGLT